MLASFLPALLLSPLALAYTVPSQLFSPLIPKKVLATTQRLPSSLNAYPQYTDQSAGLWTLTGANGWTSGFFPATLYALNERVAICGATKKNGLDIADWLSLGRWSVGGLIPLLNGNGVGHDQGFLSFPFVDELEVNPSNATAISAVNGFARILAGRFVPVVGVTRSWDSRDVTVIIDNMINLELFFVAADLTGNNTYREMAISHADVTVKNHIREDGSTWHVVEYSAVDGRVLAKHTAQGYSDSSTWTRGQAWGIYGFANIFKRTGKEDYLVTARRLANFFLAHIPANGIVPWDFDAPPDSVTGVVPADSSAATLAASGLLFLAELETNSARKKKYIDGAISILHAITKFAFKDEAAGWQSVLSNGTINRPQNLYSTGVVYADYYYILAGNALVNLGLASC